MRLLLIIAVLSLCLCSSAWAQGWTMMGEPLAKQLGGSSSNGAACGVVPNFGSGWSEDMASFSNCLNSDLIQLPNNGVRVTWSQLTNCPTLEHFDRNLVYSMYWSPDSSTWTLINSQTNNTRASEWMTNDVPAPYRTNGYYTVMVRESDWTGGGAPAIADWYYVTNTFTFVPPDHNLSDGSENAVPGFRFFTNTGPVGLVYMGKVGSGPQAADLLTSNSYGRNAFTFSLDPNDPTIETNGQGCAWWIAPTIYNIGNAILGCAGAGLSASYDLHEFGHAPFLIGHADSVNRIGDSIVTVLDGGDPFDIMGVVAQGGFLRQYNSFYLEKLGWLGAYGERPIYYTGTNSGIFTITCVADTTAGAKCVKIPRETTKVYTSGGTLGYYTNSFYYLETMTWVPTLQAPAVIARVGEPLPYKITGFTMLYKPHSKWVKNYGHNGGMIMGDSFADTYVSRVIQQVSPGGPFVTNSVTRIPFSAVVLSVTTTNATIAVIF